MQTKLMLLKNDYEETFYNSNKCKVFFDKNNDKLVICNADEKPWNN